MSAPKVDVGRRADTLPTAYPIWVIVAPANQSTPLGLLSCFGSASRLSEADKVSVSAPLRGKYKGVSNMQELETLVRLLPQADERNADQIRLRPNCKT